MAMTDKQWLHHPETGGNFHCPTDAVESWKASGWVDGEEPQKINPAIAEWVGHPAAEPAAANPKTTRRGAAAANSTEGVNDVG